MGEVESSFGGSRMGWEVWRMRIWVLKAEGVMAGLESERTILGV